MKTSIAAAVTTLAWLTAFGQGTVNFVNLNGAAGLNAPIFGGDGITKLYGPRYQAGLFAGPSAANLSLLATTPFLTGGGAGYFNGSVVAIPSVVGGGTAFIQVVAWDATLNGTTTGATFFQAVASGLPVWGESSVFSVVTGNPQATPPGLPAALVGLTSFGVPGCLGPYFEGFTAQPTNQTVVLGATVTFYVAALACPGPLYQWYFNGAPLPGAAGSSYQIAHAQRTNAGSYSVVLSNPSWGIHTSANATLTVLVEPIITSPPQSQTAFVGSSVNFQVGAAGAPTLAYQWFFNGDAISGAAGVELSLSNLQLSQAGAYTVVITNAYGAVTSPPAILTVRASPSSRIRVVN